jgi:hypothetical protein
VPEPSVETVPPRECPAMAVYRGVRIQLMHWVIPGSTDR